MGLVLAQDIKLAANVGRLGAVQTLFQLLTPTQKPPTLSAALDCLKLTTASAECIDAVTENSAVLAHLFLLMADVPALSASILGIVNDFATHSAKVVLEAMRHGELRWTSLLWRPRVALRGATLRYSAPPSNPPSISPSTRRAGIVSYALDIMVNQKDAALSAKATALVAKMARDKMHGAKISKQLAHYLPAGVVMTLADEGQAASFSIHKSYSTPEVMWNNELCKVFQAALVEKVSALAAGQRAAVAAHGSGEEGEGEDLGSQGEQCKALLKAAALESLGEAVGYDELSKELFLGGCYLRLYLKEPQYEMRNPRKFFEGCMQRYLEIVDPEKEPPESEKAYGAGEISHITTAAVCVLKVRTDLADHLVNLGYLGGVMDGCSTDFTKRCMLKLLHELATNRACVNKFAATDVVERLLKMCSADLKELLLPLQIMSRMMLTSDGSPTQGTIVGQMMEGELVELLFTLLDGPAVDTGDRDRLARVTATNVLKTMSGNSLHAEDVEAKLSAYDSWPEYRDQKHDLFVASDSSVMSEVLSLTN